jgi:HAD superfamily hydrolase (TIGR01490 family)
MQTAAFFDIDGTLYREGLITAMFKKLIRTEIIEGHRWYNEVRDKYERWDKRVGNYDDYLLKMAEIYVEAVRGLHRTQIEFIAEKVVAQNGDRVYVFTRDRIQWHREQGHRLIIISGSPEELVKYMAMKHGFDDYIGTRYQRNEQDLFTGEIEPMWDSISKEKAMDRFAHKFNLDLSQSYAYGDTAGDMAMFAKVGHPVAVNPTRELLQKIHNDPETRQRALVIVERKDMIYRLNMDVCESFLSSSEDMS